ncbi:MAG: hypothetical protein JWO93_1941 [Micrococcaceae bacterium]|jgi:hypothetical protein|nr:hypothetical protein [Micrococcaceae bacterium]
MSDNASTDQPVVHLSAEASERLADARKESLARKNDAGRQQGVPPSGGGHKPEHASGRQGGREKKVRW